MSTNTKHDLTTEEQARAAFWSESPMRIRILRRNGKRQNDYGPFIRTAWCDWVDAAQKDGRMSEELAQRVTL